MELENISRWKGNPSEMNTELVWLPPQATVYVKSALSESRTSLADQVLKHHDLSQGDVYTYLPLGMALEDAMQFDNGIFQADMAGTSLVRSISNLDELMEREIRTYLTSSDHRVAVFQDSAFGAHSPVVLTTDLTTAIHGDDVYYIVRQQEREILQIGDAIRSARSWQQVVFLVSAHWDISLDQNRLQIGADTLQDLATGAERIIVGAYDYEGFVVWVATVAGKPIDDMR
jgi:hypothetical protein